MLKYLMQIKRFSSLASILAGLSMSWNVAGAAVAPAPVPAAADDILAAVVTNWRRHDTGDVPLPTTIAVPAAIDMLYFGMPVRPSLRPSRGTIPTGIIIDTRPTDRRTERLSLANPHAVAELLALADHTLAAQRLMAEYQPQALVTAALQAEEHGRPELNSTLRPTLISPGIAAVYHDVTPANLRELPRPDHVIYSLILILTAIAISRNN